MTPQEFSVVLKIPAVLVRNFRFYKVAVSSYLQLYTPVKAEPVEIVEQRLVRDFLLFQAGFHEKDMLFQSFRHFPKLLKMDILDLK